MKATIYEPYRLFLGLYGGDQPLDSIEAIKNPVNYIRFEELIYVYPDALIDHILEFYGLEVGNCGRVLYITINI